MWLYEAEPIHFECTCSQKKTENMIRSLGEAEANEVINQQGEITINCQFCNKQYKLDSIDIQRIFSITHSAGTGRVH